MANKLYDEAHIQDIAAAIREKNGSSATYKVSQMGAAVRAITSGSGGGQSGDGTDVALSVLRGTISDLSPFSGLTSIRGGAFMNCKSITSASFPACTSIGSYAFNSCTSLTSVSFPACTSIGSYAFASCTSLTSVNFPVCKTISTYTFRSCASLVSANFPVCTSIGTYAFSNCTSLKTANFAACTVVTNAVFYNCSSLKSAVFSASKFYSSAFTNCSRLMSLTNTYSSVATLSNTNAFQNTPMSESSYTGAFGSIYVPASLVASYKAATNWATYAARITSIPE